MTKPNIPKDEKLELALLEAIYIMRWDKEQTALTAVLTEEECNQIVSEIHKKLNRAGYKIVKK